jgi:hypothetical protein
MRIVGGRFAGRDLVSPLDLRAHDGGHVRAGLLDLVGHRTCTTRASSISSLERERWASRRSARAVAWIFVEFRPASLHALKANVAALRLRDAPDLQRDALPFVAARGRPLRHRVRRPAVRVAHVGSGDRQLARLPVFANSRRGALGGARRVGRARLVYEGNAHYWFTRIGS